MEVKTCSKCKESKELSAFGKNKQAKSGLDGYCFLCKALIRVERKDIIRLENKRYREKNKKRIIEKQKEWYKNNKEKHINTCRKYYILNKEKILEYSKKWYEDNKEHASKVKKKWSKNNPEKVEKYAQKRLMAEKRASFKDETINKIVDSIYANCPQGMSVDHYYPVQGKEVCGLNVPWNMQYLPKSENQSKQDKMPIEPIKDNLSDFVKAQIAEYLKKV